MPVVLAIAASRRCFSCSALKEASRLLRLLLGMMDGAVGIGADLVDPPLSLPSAMMASVVNLQVLNSGRCASSLSFGFSSGWQRTCRAATSCCLPAACRKPC